MKYLKYLYNIFSKALLVIMIFIIIIMMIDTFTVSTFSPFNLPCPKRIEMIFQLLVDLKIFKTEAPLYMNSEQFIKKFKHPSIAKCPSGNEYSIKSDGKSVVTITCLTHGTYKFIINSDKKYKIIDGIPSLVD